MMSIESLKDLPVNGIVLATIANDVLSSVGFPAAVLYIHEGIVVKQLLVVDGCHHMEDLLGKSIMELDEWRRTDYTGTHPEVAYCLDLIATGDKNDLPNSIPKGTTYESNA